MKKPTVLWIGMNRKRCTVLAEIYRDVISSVYADDIAPDELSARAGKFNAVILVLDYNERADTALCRAVYACSAKRRIPVYFMGQPNQLRAAFMICPNAFLRLIGDEEIAEVFSGEIPRRPPPSLPVAVAFFDDPIYAVFLKEKLDPALTAKLRVVYAEPNPNYIDRMKRKGIRPKLFLFDENIPSCKFFTARFDGEASLRRIPYLMLGTSDRISVTVGEGTKPFRSINVLRDGGRLSDTIREAAGIN